MKILKIDTDSTITAVEVTGTTIREQNNSIYKLLGGFFDIVRLGEDAALLVDDEGVLKGLPVNTAAMMISGYPYIAGTALLVGLERTEDGDIFTDAPDRFLSLIDKEST